MSSEHPGVASSEFAWAEAPFFFERSLDLLTVLGMDGYFKWVNPMFTQIFGYSAGELLAHPFIQFVHPEDRPVTLAEMEKLVAGVPTRYFENRYQAKDGSYRWVSWTASPQLDQRVIYGIARDVTHQKQIETERAQLEVALKQANQKLEQRVAERTAQLAQVNEALRESEERNQLAMEVARMFSFEWEPATDIVKRSPHCGIILGLSEEEAEQDTGANFLQRIHPDDRPAFVSCLQALTPNQSNYKTTYRVICPDGQTVILEESGRALFNSQGDFIRLIGMTADVTGRRRLEAELEANRATLQRQLAEIETIYQSAPIGLNVLDTDLRFVRINQRLAEINGLPAEAHIGKSIRELLPDIADTTEALLFPILTTGEPLLNVEIRGETPAQPGVPRVWRESFLPLKEGDRVIGINTVCEEITERIRIEEALRQSEARFRTMADNAPVMVWVTDAHGSCTYLSQSWYEFTGQTEAIGLGYGWLEALHPDDCATAREKFISANACRAGFRLEYRLRHRSGAYRWAIAAASPWVGADGQYQGYIGSVIDITDRKHAEEALRQSEERYRTLFETMEDGFCVIEVLFDRANQPRDYRFLEINPAFERQTGLQNALGKTVLQLLPDLETFWIETYGRVALTGETMRFENGSEVMNRWFEVYTFRVGQPTERKVAILFKDISDRKKSEMALQENEDRLRMAIASAQLGTWDWHLLSGQLKWDVGCKAMFGLPPDAESSIDVFFAGIHPADRDRVEAIVQTALDPASGGAFETEYRTIGLQDHIERWIMAKGQAYYDSNGKPLRFSGTVLDITQQKQATAQREQLLRQEQAAREAAEHANRIKDEFLTVLSHELRTPLNPILGWAKILQSPKTTPEKLQQGLTTIERNAKQQVQLIDDLLDISRIIRGKLTLNFDAVDLAEAILAALDTVQLAVEAKAIALEVNLDPDVGQIRGDASRLQQMVWNMLANAVKFTPIGGQITVALSLVANSDRSDPLSSEATEVTMPSVADSSLRYAQIQIQDTGKGIAPHFLPHVFELFQQQDSSTTRSFGGLGLGLAISQQIAEAHGGTITAASQGEGQGATFTVQLPLMVESPLPSPNALKRRDRSLRHLRVLVVDDEVDSLELVKILLEPEGIKVCLAASGAQALRLLTETSFDLLISDIGMPQMDGYSLIRQIRTLPPHLPRQIPAIALTAYAGEANQRQILAAGFQTHLAKPIEPHYLLDAIATLVTS